MTSVLGAVWTGVQSVGWLFYLLHQLVTDTLNINYRVVSAVGQLVAALSKILYALLGSVVLAVYEVLGYVLLAVAGFLSFLFDCLCFVLHCGVLLCQVIYYTVALLADGVFFVVLVPIFACQTIHSWVSWIFNTESWMNAAVWCFEAFCSAIALAGNKSWELVEFLTTTIGKWISAMATFAYESTMFVCYSIYNGLISVLSFIDGIIAFTILQTWNFVTFPLYFVYDFSVAMLANAYDLLQLCTVNHICLTVIVLIGVLILLFGANQLIRLLRRFFRHSRGEVIHINFNDPDDIIEVSDDEQDDFRHRANLLGLAEENDVETIEDTDDDSDISDVSDEVSDDSDIGSDADDDDSADTDAEAIDVQLPDQPSTSLANGRMHGYATRSKGNVEQPQTQHVEPDRERSLCVICQDQVKSVLVLPCRHMCMCVDCARTVVNGTHGQRRICPLCRGNIRIVMNVYT